VVGALLAAGALCTHVTVALLKNQQLGGTVSCGDHRAETCECCTAQVGNGTVDVRRAWCNGDCHWHPSPSRTTGTCRDEPAAPASTVTTATTTTTTTVLPCMPCELLHVGRKVTVARRLLGAVDVGEDCIVTDVARGGCKDSECRSVEVEVLAKHQTWQRAKVKGGRVRMPAVYLGENPQWSEHPPFPSFEPDPVTGLPLQVWSPMVARWHSKVRMGIGLAPRTSRPIPGGALAALLESYYTRPIRSAQRLPPGQFLLTFDDGPHLGGGFDQLPALLDSPGRHECPAV